jgi:hypothetical protein
MSIGDRKRQERWEEIRTVVPLIRGEVRISKMRDRRLLPPSHIWRCGSKHWRFDVVQCLQGNSVTKAESGMKYGCSRHRYYSVEVHQRLVRSRSSVDRKDASAPQYIRCWGSCALSRPTTQC